MKHGHGTLPSRTFVLTGSMSQCHWLTKEKITEEM